MKYSKLIAFLLVSLPVHALLQNDDNFSLTSTIDGKDNSSPKNGYEDDKEEDLPNEKEPAQDNPSNNFDWKDLICEDVSNVPLKDQCQFITLKCQDHQLGLLNYYKLYYCTSESNAIKKGVIIPLSVFILIVLFIWLGLTASEFLCPNLSAISNYLRIPENISGLTLLAFGNGSPDIMSTYSSFQTSNASLAVGELIGAAFFITSFIIGTIVIVRPFSLISEKSSTTTIDNVDDASAYKLLISNDKAVYVRDLVFFLLSVLLTMIFLRDGQLTKPRLIVLVCVYIIYVIVVSIWQWFVLNKHKRIVEDDRIRNMYDDSSVLDLSGNDLEFEDRYSFNPMILNNIEFGSILSSLTQKQTVKIKLSNLARYRDDDQEYESRMNRYGIEEDDDEEHRQQSQQEEPPKPRSNTLKKIFGFFTAPIQVLLKLTIPLIVFEQYGMETRFGFNEFMLFLASIFLSPFVFIQSFIDEPTLTNYLLATIIGSVTIFITYQNLTSHNQSDLLKLILSSIGFIASISWIGMIAEELINVLKFFSVLTRLSDAILGLTIFAIGNSIGDMISNLIIAKLGYPLMALAACFGGPLLNLLLGIGLNGLIVGGHVEVKLSLSLYLSCVWVIINLLFILIWVPMCGWKFDRLTGVIMIGIWCAGTLASVLIELVA